MGHRCFPDTLIDAQAKDAEGAIRAAVRALGDCAALRRVSDADDAEPANEGRIEEGVA